MTASKKKYGPKGSETKKWEDLIKQWKESGKSQNAFCKEKQIKPSTFSWWVRKDRKESCQLPASAPTASFVQIERLNLPGTSMSPGMGSVATDLALKLDDMDTDVQ